MSGAAFVENFLAHYASKYYDPVKAREYYLENRELKGRQSTTQLKTDKKKQAWAYAKNEIGEEKKATMQQLSDERKDVVDKARKSTQAQREEISQKLTALLNLLTKQKTDTQESIAESENAALEEVDAKRAARTRQIKEGARSQIDAIPKIPDGIQGPARERLTKARAKRIAMINGDADRQINSVRADAASESEAISADANSKRQALSAQTEQEKVSGRESATANKEQIATVLKATVDKARADYEAGKERLIAEYEVKTQKEFDAIRRRV